MIIHIHQLLEFVVKKTLAVGFQTNTPLFPTVSLISIWTKIINKTNKNNLTEGKHGDFRYGIGHRCPICNIKFRYNYNLNIHIKKEHHGLT